MTIVRKIQIAIAAVGLAATSRPAAAWTLAIDHQCTKGAVVACGMTGSVTKRHPAPTRAHAQPHG